MQIVPNFGIRWAILSKKISYKFTTITEISRATGLLYYWGKAFDMIYITFVVKFWEYVLI